MQIYLVGGAIRDKKLGLPNYDNDWVVVNATIEQMLALNYKLVGKSFPVFLHPETKEEYALARTEKKISKGHTGFSCDVNNVTLEQDLLRRDLTINAMAEINGQIIDPYNGLQDLQNRILRHVSAAFTEDPLRVLRVARFAAQLGNFNFKVAPETLALMQQMVNAGALAELTPDRVWKEFYKALNTDHLDTFIHVLIDCGALAVIFSDLNKLWQSSSLENYYPIDNFGKHTLLILREACQQIKDPIAKFAILTHNIALPALNSWFKYYNVPKKFIYIASKVAELHLLAYQANKLTELQLLDLLSSLKVFNNSKCFADFILICGYTCKHRNIASEDAAKGVNFLLALKNFLAKKSNKITIDNNLTGSSLIESIKRQRLQKIKLFLQLN